MINYLYDLLLHIINNPKLSILFILILLGLGGFLISKINLKYKNKKKLQHNTKNDNTSGNTSIKPEEHNKNYVQQHNTHTHSKNFFAESVSQVFESKTQKRSR